MTVQELIDKLKSIEDKSVEVWASFGHDYTPEEITLCISPDDGSVRLE
jgi:hypothetical protein